VGEIAFSLPVRQPCSHRLFSWRPWAVQHSRLILPNAIYIQVWWPRIRGSWCFNASKHRRLDASRPTSPGRPKSRRCARRMQADPLRATLRKTLRKTLPKKRTRHHHAILKDSGSSSRTFWNGSAKQSF